VRGLPWKRTSSLREYGAAMITVADRAAMS
jgi:hypothetical protein